MKGRLILENGLVFEGKVFGYIEQSVGEVVFNTSMTGYQEILTDPSYYGQMVVMTYPMIGNYGLNLDDLESDGGKVRGLIIKEPAKLPNNFRCEMTLEGYLRQHKIIGFKGIDTRHLTKVIRDKGVMKGIITTEELTQEQIKKEIGKFSNLEAVSIVSTKNTYEMPCNKKEVVAKIGMIDYGIKRNIIRSFHEKGCDLTVFPWDVTAKEVLEHNIDGIFLSNGPGDPAQLKEVVEEIKKMIGKKPIVGICLGHQLLAIALGGSTMKLKFGHRGANHPVKDLEKNKIFITSQNHGYVVDKIPEGVDVTQINLNDNSIEGMKDYKNKIASVQYHPEASPGPKDSKYIFDDFIKLIKEA